MRNTQKNSRKLVRAAQRGNVVKMRGHLEEILRISGSGNWWGPDKILWTAYTAAVRNDCVDCAVAFAMRFEDAGLAVGCFFSTTDGASHVCSAFVAAVLYGAFHTATALMHLFDTTKCTSMMRTLYFASVDRSVVLTNVLCMTLWYAPRQTTQFAAVRFLTNLKADVNLRWRGGDNCRRSPLEMVLLQASKEIQDEGHRYLASAFRMLQLLIRSRASVDEHDADRKSGDPSPLRMLVDEHGRHVQTLKTHDDQIRGNQIRDDQTRDNQIRGNQIQNILLRQRRAAVDAFLLNATRVVLFAKADPNAADKSGQTAIDCAVAHQDDAILALLRT
jgi:hypothetical protein